jgi:4-nitrophenyl phosphatase
MSSSTREMNINTGIERVRNARGFVFDLDGTMVLGNKNNEGLQVLDGAAELLALLSDRDIPYVVLTNGTVRPPEAYERKLTAAGLPVTASRIMTPASVAADHFVSEGMKRVLVLGVEGVWKPLRDAGLEVLLPSEEAIDPDTQFDAVFVGWYREFVLDEIEAAVHAVNGGAKLFAASLVPFFATQGGRAMGSSRAVSAMITSLTDVEAEAIGKPSPFALRSAARRLGREASEIAVVGDDPDLETLMALEGGAVAVGVQSGVAGAKDFAGLPDDRAPHLTVTGVSELLDVLK